MYYIITALTTARDDELGIESTCAIITNVIETHHQLNNCSEVDTDSR